MRKEFSVRCPNCDNLIWVGDKQKAFHCSMCGKTFTSGSKELTSFEIEQNPKMLLSNRPLFDSIVKE